MSNLHFSGNYQAGATDLEEARDTAAVRVAPKLERGYDIPWLFLPSHPAFNKCPQLEKPPWESEIKEAWGIDFLIYRSGQRRAGNESEIK